jgi:uncharacterized membrane protein YfbV (UPF0208 family)
MNNNSTAPNVSSLANAVLRLVVPFASMGILSHKALTPLQDRSLHHFLETAMPEFRKDRKGCLLGKIRI